MAIKKLFYGLDYYKSLETLNVNELYYNHNINLLTRLLEKKKINSFEKKL